MTRKQMIEPCVLGLIRVQSLNKSCFTVDGFFMYFTLAAALAVFEGITLLTVLQIKVI